MENIITFFASLLLDSNTSKVNDLIRLMVAKYLAQKQDFDLMIKVLLSLKLDVKYQVNYKEWDGSSIKFSHGGCGWEHYDAVLIDGSLKRICDGHISYKENHVSNATAIFKEKAENYLEREILEIITEANKGKKKITYQEVKELVLGLKDKNIIDLDIKNILIILNDPKAWEGYSFDKL